MSIALAEQLKTDLTDKFVIVAEGVPELRRFSGLTGKVKTVNMSCRALVQFDGPVDIGWYDIDPAFLKVIDAPLPKKSESKPEAKAAPAPAAEKPAVAKPAGKSPLDAIRAAGAPKPSAAAPAASGAKPSPLDMIRKQVTAKAGSDATSAAETSTPAPSTPAPAGSSATGAKLSPLEQIRQAAAAKAAGETVTQSSAPLASNAQSATSDGSADSTSMASTPPVAEASPPVTPAAPIPSAAGRPKSTAEILAAIRKQSGQ